MYDPQSNSADAFAIELAASLIEQADMPIVGAGAGMGDDSGLPDFHGKDGFWLAYPPLRDAEIDFHTIASPFRSLPELVWAFYGHRLALYRQMVSHQGHALLKHWGERNYPSPASSVVVPNA